MATITPTMTSYPEPGSPKAWVITWGPMQANDIGVPADLMFAHADRSVQVEGTFGVGGSVALEGSNDGSNFRPLTSPVGNIIAVTAGSVEAIVEACRLYRPHVTSGDGSTSVTVSLYLRRTTPGL